MSTFSRAPIAVVLLLGLVAVPAAQTPLPSPGSAAWFAILRDVPAAQAFRHDVDQYVLLHRWLEAPLPPLDMAGDLDAVAQTMSVLRIRIQWARPGARQGDIFTPDVAPLFRRRVAACLTADEWRDILDDMARDEEGRAVRSVALRVNMEWPAAMPFEFVPPQLLQALPALPPELQYRIIGRSLVLWDHHANLIVDFLPGAFADLT